MMIRNWIIPIVALMVSHSLYADEYGIPLGGIGTGKIELLPSGGFGAFTLHHLPHEPLQNTGQSFAAIYVNQNGNPLVKKLMTGDAQGVESVRIEGVYPFERMVYEDQSLPVKVTLEAYSHIMLRDADASAVPGAVLRYRVENTGNSETEAALALSFQNIISGINNQQSVRFEAGEIRHEAFSSGNKHGVEMRFTSSEDEGTNGSISLMAIAAKNDSVSLMPSWNAAENDAWVRFNADGQFVESTDKRIKQQVDQSSHPSSAVAVKRMIPAQSSSTFTFVIAWHSPTWVSTRGEAFTVRYADEWDSSMKTAERLANDDEKNREAMMAWSDRFQHSRLPEPLLASVMNGFKELIRKSVWLNDGQFSMITDDPDWQGNLGSPEERLAAMPFFLHCFPGLLRSELEMMMKSQLISGEAPSYTGRAGGSVGVMDVDGAFLNRPDSTSAFVMMLYEYYLWTGDAEYLETIYPHIRSAVVWLLAQDETGDGVPDGDSFLGCTKRGQLSLWTADSFLAALRAGEETGLLMKDLELQNQCYNARQRITQNVISQLWNGESFHAQFNPSNPSHVDGQSAYPGTWFLKVNGLYTHFTPDKLLSSMKTLSSTRNTYSFDDSSQLSTQNKWLNAAMLTEHGYAGRIIEIHQQPTHNMAAWSWWNRMTGVSLDMPRQALIISPRFLLHEDVMQYLLLTPVMDGTVEAHRSQRTGIVECNITFEQQWGNSKIVLNELAFSPVSGQNPNDFILHVIYKNEIISGQDFVRESLKIFRFAKPITFAKGDTVTMTLSPLDSGKVFANLDNGNLINLGVNCTVETIRVSPEQFSFRLKNLQQENQLVRLETGGERAAQYTVYLNGNPVGSAAAGVSTVPLFLRASPIPADDYAWLNYSRTGCAQTVPHIEGINNPALKNRLWDLQQEIEKAYLADSDLRGYQVDILSADTKLVPNPKEFEYDPRRVIDRINDARKRMDDFLRELPNIARDPVLAAEITGFFVPLTMQAKITNAGMLQEPFTVDVKVGNDAQLHARARLGIELPPDWRYEADGMVEHILDKAVSSFNSRFTVHPNTALQQQRFGIRLILSGAWNNYAFRRYADLAVGHNFVKTWMVAGPFENNGGQGFEQRFPIELNIKTSETYKSGDHDIAWQEMTFPDGFVDFDTTFKPNDDAVGFAYAAVYSLREQQVTVHLGVDEGVKVFHNYKEVYSKYRTSSMRPGTERFSLRLFEGWNHILIKVQEHQGVWGFFMEITDPTGRAIPELQYTLDKSK